MRRILTLLATVVALTGCKIEEAEYFDPTADGYRMLLTANRCLTEEAAAASRVMLFNLYYSAPDEERETLHDRYFYTSRIVGSGNEWRIIDRDGELVIRTDGQPLSTDGAVWQYASLRPTAAEATITCRRNGDETAYDLRLPDDGGRFSFTTAYPSRTEEDGATRYWCELSLTGSGVCIEESMPYGFEKVACETTEPLKYVSTRPKRFEAGALKLTAETDGDELEATAEYLPGNRIAVACGPYSNEYYWYW